MSINDRVLLDSIVKDKHSQIAPDMAEDDFFELFLAEQLLWEHDLSWDELQSGLTGGGDDGGMDAIYIFCNGRLLDADVDLSLPVKASATFELIIIQAKRSPSFGEAAIEKLSASLLRLLNLDKDLKDMRSLYNSDVISWFDRFRSYYLCSASTFPSVDIRIYYGSRGFDVNHKVKKKASELEASIDALFSASTCEFNFVTPSELVALARRQRPTTLDLHLEEAMATATGGFVGLASISRYFEFICADNGDLRNVIFESNVRDYEGSGGVNASIRKTLEGDSGEDFWWLNNGVTIVASRAAQYGKTLTLEYPQIVNGLQTSREIYEYVTAAKKEFGTVRDRRAVLIRVVVPPNDDSRDRIIRATNSQTAIPSVALRATDKIQRDLEDYFLREDWYYERRKNRYQNENKPISRIITIPFLAEAILAIILREPHLGGPRLGGRFLKAEDVYERIFDSSVPLVGYLKSAQITRLVELRFRDDQVTAEWNKYREREQAKGDPGALPEELPGLSPAQRRHRRRRGKTVVLYRPHRYLLPVATAVALSRSNNRYITDLAEFDPESISSEEIAQWMIRIAELDPSRAQAGMQPERADRILAEKLLASLRPEK